MKTRSAADGNWASMARASFSARGNANVHCRKGTLGKTSSTRCAAVSAPSLRAGEVPLGVEIGESRRHELGFAVRATAGVFNNGSFVWWNFPRQRLAVSVDAAVGCTILF